MTKEAILKAAIEKAVKNGYKNPYVEGAYDLLAENRTHYIFIFSHDFAKAFLERFL